MVLPSRRCDSSNPIITILSKLQTELKFHILLIIPMLKLAQMKLVFVLFTQKVEIIARPIAMLKG